MTRTELASKVWEAELASGASEASASAAADAVICGTYEQYQELRAGQNVCPVCHGKGWVQTAPGLGESPADAQVPCPLCASDTRKREPVTEAAPF